MISSTFEACEFPVVKLEELKAVSSQIGVAGTVPDEDYVLPEGLIALEAGMKPTDMSMIHLEKSSRAVDATKLQSEDSLILGDFPDKNNETDRAALRIVLLEQSHYFVDGRRLWLLDLC